MGEKRPTPQNPSKNSDFPPYYPWGALPNNPTEKRPTSQNPSKNPYFPPYYPWGALPNNLMQFPTPQGYPQGFPNNPMQFSAPQGYPPYFHPPQGYPSQLNPLQAQGHHSQVGMPPSEDAYTSSSNASEATASRPTMGQNQSNKKAKIRKEKKEVVDDETRASKTCEDQAERFLRLQEYEVLMKDTSNMSEEHLEIHKEMCADIRKRWKGGNS